MLSTKFTIIHGFTVWRQSQKEDILSTIYQCLTRHAVWSWRKPKFLYKFLCIYIKKKSRLDIGRPEYLRAPHPNFRLPLIFALPRHPYPSSK